MRRAGEMAHNRKMEDPKPDPSEPDSSEGQPLSAAGEGHTGGEPAQPAADSVDLPASPDDKAEQERQAKLVRDGSGF